MLFRMAPILIVAVLMTIVSCRRDGYYDATDVEVSFSEDTLRFDTVFTTLGSATRYIKVYNPKDQPILVDVTLRNQTNSFFRINADGLKGPSVEGLEINAKDSIYIFVEVTINPDLPLNISPFIIEDQIEVSVNGNTSIAHLEAWGQNANYIPSSASAGTASLLSCNFGEEVWDDPKPYVIYGILYVDDCTLVLPPGTKVYVHGGVIRNENSIYNDGLLVFQKNGSLKSQGTILEPVIIQGDRLEEEFANTKSQWVGVLFWQESKKNTLSNTIIRNSIIGLRADSLADVSLYGCQIYNTGGPGIIGRHAKIYGENCLLYSNATYGIQLTYGGDYTFNYCSVASYEGQNEAVIITDFYCEDILCSTGVKVNKLNANFNNCIFAGSNIDEVGIVQVSETNDDFQYKFTNCLVRVDELLLPKNTPDFFDHCENCLDQKQNDRIFLDQNADDFRLDTMSVALGLARPLVSVKEDIIGKLRKEMPDMGCYEF